ncbi:protein NDRG2-like [Chlamydotis macqueenii]
MGWEGVAVGRYGSGPAPQLLHPEAVEGLVLININPRAKGWVDWVAHKLSGLTSSSSELILAHLFTQEELAAAPPPVQQARRRLGAAPNAPLLWAMYNSRGDLGLQRSGANSLRCPVLLVVGDNSPHKDAMVSDVTGDVTGPPVMSPGLL